MPVLPVLCANSISRDGMLFFVYSLPQNVLLVRTENSRAIPQEKKFEKGLAKQISLCIIPSYKFFDENTTFRLLCYSESGMVKADRASANRYHL